MDVAMKRIASGERTAAEGPRRERRQGPPRTIRSHGASSSQFNACAATRVHDVQDHLKNDASPGAHAPGLEWDVVQRLAKERATGLEPATSSLGSWHSTN